MAERANARSDLSQEVRQFAALRHVQSQICDVEEPGIAFEVREAETGEEANEKRPAEVRGKATPPTCGKSVLGRK